jgi:hypothetical protein
MNERDLKSLLREAPVPAREDAELRGLRVVEAAFAQRRPARRDVRAQLAAAVALAALLGALMLSPAGAAVRDWVGDVFATGVPDAEPGLTEIPGGGHLLVQSAAGPWVVQPDGSRRLLGDFDQATWSPRGLFVGVASGRTLSALEPDGDPRWSVPAPAAVSDPRWSPSGFRIAYRAAGELRVVGADGEGDALLDPSVAPVPPAWSPLGSEQLAYVDGDGRLRIAESATGKSVASAPMLPRVERLEWAADGSMLLEASPRSLRLRALTAHKLMASVGVEAAREIELPGPATIRDAALSPDGDSVAVLLALRSAGRPRSLVLLTGTRGGPSRRLFSTPGRLAQLAWSPDASRLLISWPEADQWLFIPTDGPGRVRAIAGIAAEFAPGGSSSAFPQIEDWCCPATAGPLG